MAVYVTDRNRTTSRCFVILIDQFVRSTGKEAGAELRLLAPNTRENRLYAPSEASIEPPIDISSCL
jgi:hypothetical protein